MTYINKSLQDKFGFTDESDDEQDEERPRSNSQLAKIVPPLRPNNVTIVIRKFNKAIENDVLSFAEVNILREKLISFGDKNNYLSEQISARLYEYEALLLDTLGMRQDAINSIRQAYALLDNDRRFVTEWGKALLDSKPDAIRTPVQPLESSQPAIQKTRFYKRKLFYAAIVVLLILVWQPIAEWYTIVSATPAQKDLANNLKLTGKGKVIFLATKPEVQDTTTFGESCPPTNSGYLEEGCYIPDTNRIYIRSMPEELQSDETVTAAHEMLHAAYQKYDVSTRSRINSLVEEQYSSMSDAELTDRVTEYNKTEPGEQTAELYAILGTEFASLSPGLESEYSRYFTDRQTEVSAAAQTKSTFENYISQLNNLKGVIDSENSLADKYYSASVSWANVGNAYEDDYYYNLYSNEYNNASSNIDSYNQLVDKYNLLIDEYNGTTYTPISPVQKSGQ